MKLAVLVVALAHAVSCGNVGVQTSSLLSPAGVTYVNGAYHAGLAAGPLAYSASVAQPVFQAAAPVAYAGRYAAVPTVEHVPGVADVPVTRLEAQPGVIQKTVDVARPAVKTQRYEVRRPAIQKQFYDIEERVVVRPAGSAVVELNEPLSKTQKGPSVITSAGDGVAITSSAVAAPAPPPADLPSVEINLSRDSFATGAPAPPPAGISSADVNFARSSFAAASADQINFARSSFVAAPSASPAPQITYAAGPAVSSVSPAPQINFARTSYAAPPSGPVVASAPAPQINFARTSYAAPPSGPVVASAPAPQITYARTSYAAPPSGPVVASAPAPQINFARTYAAAPSGPVVASAPAPQINFARASFAAAPVHSATFSAPAYPVKTVSVSAPLQVSAPVAVSAPIQTVTGVSSISSGSSGISSVSGAPGISFSTPAPQYQQQIVQSTPTPDYSDDSVSVDNAELSLARSGAAARQGYAGQSSGQQVFAAAQEPAFRTGYQTQASAAARSSLTVNYPNALDLVPQHRFRATPVYTQENSQSEINHENQQRLIQLLTARGGVTEIGFGRSGSASYPVDAGNVRARVLSATPAPAYSAPTDERVNTRRVVVSRPIETLQEVEVAEPVTKYERVRVDQPTVFKTARQDILRVPTSVPVYGKTLAPIAESAPVAYSAGWH